MVKRREERNEKGESTSNFSFLSLIFFINIG